MADRVNISMLPAAAVDSRIYTGARWVRGAVPATLVAGMVGWSAIENGGFFATSWGWPTLAALLTVAAVLTSAEHSRLRRQDLLLLGALAGFVTWTALSALWSPGAELPVQAAELALLYLAAVTAFLLLGSTSLPLGVLVAVTPVAAYSLATRLVPDHIGRYDPTVGGYLLAGPTGYQNCLGALCAIAALLALGLVAQTRRLAVRIVAAAVLPLLITTLYFTFSRGAAAVLVLGLVVALALDRHRIRFAVIALAALPLPLLGAWLGSRSAPLTHAGASLHAAAGDGHRVLAAVLVLTALEAGAVVLLARLERRVTPTPSLRRATRAALTALAVALIAAGLVRIGDPVTFVNNATDAFSAEAPGANGNLSRRLTTLSGHTRSQYWAVAWKEALANPVLGGGAGSFRRYWLRDRTTRVDVVNAHNLYLETLAELGPVGLLLLVAALAAPLAALRRARGQPLIPVVAGAYVAMLVHAAVDWDWQLPALTLSVLALGATVVIAGRRPSEARHFPTNLRIAAVPALLAVIGFVFVAQVGNNALAGAEAAANRGDYAAAVQQARNSSAWLVWAASPFRQIGEAQLADGELARAQSSFKDAIARDGSDWASWLGLGLASSGPERQYVLARAAGLNPLGKPDDRATASTVRTAPPG